MVALFVLPNSCEQENITTDPIKVLIDKNKAAPNFTILLYDMDRTGVFTKSYKQRFRVLQEKQGRVVAEDTEWYNVNAARYNQHESNIGMEVAAKNDSGAIKQVVGPPGYTNYIGNPQYGFWTMGVNDTIILKEKVRSSAISLQEISFYDFNTKTTVILQGMPRAGWENWTKVPADFKVDTAYPKENMFRVADNSTELQALATQYYWQFYPHYDYVRALLQLPTGKIKLKEYQTAREQYRRGYSYYGILLMGGNRRYGTYSTYTRSNSAGRRFSRGGGGYGK